MDSFIVYTDDNIVYLDIRTGSRTTVNNFTHPKTIYYTKSLTGIALYLAPFLTIFIGNLSITRFFGKGSDTYT